MHLGKDVTGDGQASFSSGGGYGYESGNSSADGCVQADNADSALIHKPLKVKQAGLLIADCNRIEKVLSQKCGALVIVEANWIFNPSHVELAPLRGIFQQTLYRAKLPIEINHEGRTSGHFL